jgi:hypothetical protein
MYCLNVAAKGWLPHQITEGILMTGGGDERGKYQTIKTLQKNLVYISNYI